MARDISARAFGWPELGINAQLKKVHLHPCIEPHDTTEVMRHSHIISSDVDLLNQYGYDSDFTSESKFSSAVRKFSNKVNAKLLRYLQGFNHTLMTMRIIKVRLKNITEIQENLKLHSEATATTSNSNRKGHKKIHSCRPKGQRKIKSKRGLMSDEASTKIE